MAAAAGEPTFQEAMALAGTWLGQWDAGELSDEVLADQVGRLVSSRDGARGFFVVSLPGGSPLLDRLPEPLLLQLRQAGEPLVDLSVRNLAMASAMELHHRRHGDAEHEAGSQRVRERSSELLRHLEPQLVKQRLEQLIEALTRQTGPDQAFLERWGYDAEQREAIQAAVLAVAD